MAMLEYLGVGLFPVPSEKEMILTAENGLCRS